MTAVFFDLCDGLQLIFKEFQQQSIWTKTSLERFPRGASNLFYWKYFS